jgi:GTPase SAR1 family protein
MAMSTLISRRDAQITGESVQLESQQCPLLSMQIAEQVPAREVIAEVERISPREAEGIPSIFVREQHELDCFEAVSAIELLGIAWHSRRTHTENSEERDTSSRSFDKVLRSLLASLSFNQRLEFVYEVCRVLNGPPVFDWRIVSHIHSNDSGRAVEQSELFWRSAGYVTADLGFSLRFKPTTAEEKLIGETNRSSTATIYPAGISISPTSSRMGFVRDLGASDHPLLVPYASGKPSGTISSLLNSRHSLELILSFECFKLSEDERRETAQCLAWLRDGSPKKILYSEEITLEQAELLSSLDKNLENWCRNPRGYRVLCEVKSKESLPIALLHRIGTEVFSGRPFSINFDQEFASEQSAKQVSRQLDLRCCFNDLGEMPAAFPSLTSLMDRGVNRLYPLPNLPFPAKGALIGRIDNGWMERDVRLKDSDRSTHLAIVGSTGTGKSTLLHSLIRHSIENGDGLILLDPHGHLYRQALESVPARRAKDVVLIDFTDFEHAVGINFLETSGPHKQMLTNFVANEMIKIFDRLYDLRQTGGPMFEQYMRSALMLLMENEFQGGTLVEVPVLFQDSDFRQYLIEHCGNPYVTTFWTQQAERACGEISLANMAPYITSKLNQFTNNALVRAVIGQSKSTVNFQDILNGGKILLVNLSKGLLSQMDAQLLGMLIMGKIFAAAMERSASSDSCRKTFMFVDEFGNFATDTASYMLSESRMFDHGISEFGSIECAGW